MVCPQAAREAQSGDRLRVDLTAGTVENVTRGATYEAVALPAFMEELIKRGGLLPYVKARLDEGAARG